MDITNIVICPFVSAPCIADGWNQRSDTTGIFMPCKFYDENNEVEPCELKRAIHKFLEIEPGENKPVEVPFDTDKRK